ncbi:hypothetical protein Y032_0214g2330 [Ancylostoma ceylanicum]|uniref:Uncharacterized protein n=1 Tax=Ancylostoma ceylanicum TaxID=53326 RepID=A0A016SJG0_9BILA|nr:hypothetical protein Y032_0214g2330 [Ancylostoma ceylanicum]
MPSCFDEKYGQLMFLNAHFITPRFCSIMKLFDILRSGLDVVVLVVGCRPKPILLTRPGTDLLICRLCNAWFGWDS